VYFYFSGTRVALFNITMALPLPRQSNRLVHLNDTDTLNKYADALYSVIRAFQEAVGTPPTVLNIGAQGGLLAASALQNGAKHVTVVDYNQTALNRAQRYLEAIPYAKSMYTLKRAHSVQLPASPAYDLLVFDVFGHSASTMSAATCDLLRRGVINRFMGANYLVVPYECTTTIRLYHAPSLSLEHRAIYHGMVVATEPREVVPGTHVRWRKSNVCMYNMRAISERVEIQHDVFDTESMTFQTHPSFVRLLPTEKQLPVDEVMIVTEFSALLTPQLRLNNVINDQTVDYRSASARALAWGFDYAPLETIAADLDVLCFKVKPNASLTKTDNVFMDVQEKATTLSKFGKMVETTYAKVAMQNQ
jgi:hypothetical protein